MDPCRSLFRRVLIRAFAGAAVVLIAVLILLGGCTGQAIFTAFVAPSLLVAGRVAVKIAVAACRRQGFTGGGRTREMRRAVGASDTAARLEMPWSRVTRGSFLSLVILCGVTAVLMELLPHLLGSVPGTEVYAYWGGAFLAMIALGALPYVFRAGPRLILDEAGITQRDPLHTETYPWHQIKRCQLDTLRDPCGELWQIIARLQDERGATVHLLIEIRTLEPADYLEPLWEALRQRFPDVEPGNAPVSHPMPSVHTI